MTSAPGGITDPPAIPPTVSRVAVDADQSTGLAVIDALRDQLRTALLLLSLNPTPRHSSSVPHSPSTAALVLQRQLESAPAQVVQFSGHETAFRTLLKVAEHRLSKTVRPGQRRLGIRRMGRPSFEWWAESPEFSLAASATDPGVPRARIRHCRMPSCS